MSSLPPIPRARVRRPVKPELDYFKAHPEVPAMASDDDFVVFNPFVEMSDEDRQSLHLNESARIAMDRAQYKPSTALTDPQRQTMAGWGGAYAEDEGLARQTVLARILSGDASLGPYSPEQEMEAQTFLGYLANAPGRRRR